MSAPVKLLLSYDIPQEKHDRYYRYVTGQFVPGAHQLGLELTEVWETAWGQYPTRLIALVATSRDAADKALATEEWQQMEKKLRQFVTRYSRRLVPYRQHFQF